MKFNINKEMTDKEIIEELTGKTSGETKQELEQFFRPINPEVKFKMPSHNCVMANEEYAVIAKSIHNKTSFGHFNLNYEYWLVGINDEGMYFCHPMTGYNGKANFEDILAWTNRVDEGFIKRVQGDVLVQFATIRPSYSSEDFEIRLPRRTINIRIYKGSQPQKELNLNNHKLSTDGWVSSQGDYTVVGGTQLILQHPQHGMVKEEIPKDHVAILTNQRGRFRNGGFD